MHLMEIDCEFGKWMELAEGHVQWRTLLLAVLKLTVPLVLPVFFTGWTLVFHSKGRTYTVFQNR